MVRERTEGEKVRGGECDWRVRFGSNRGFGSEVNTFVPAIIVLCFLVSLLFLGIGLSPRFPSLCPSPPTTSLVATPDPDTRPESPPARPEGPATLAPDAALENGVVRRSFNPVGTGAYSYVQMSAYRGGPRTFAVVGLASKPLDALGYLSYTCEYQSLSSPSASASVPGRRSFIPDWGGFARVYSVAVVNCTFPPSPDHSLSSSPVSDPDTGGRLLLHVHTNGGHDAALNQTATVEALVEPPSSWAPSDFEAPPKYDYLYCGSPLFGHLSPQRVREWLAYHVRLFGRRAHFVIQDAGGVGPEVMEVIKPWAQLGYVTVRDVTGQERFDGFYHNQVLVLNDCLHRHRFDAKWMFFFDVDEYVYVDTTSSIDSVMESLQESSQVLFEQMPMSTELCLAEDAGKSHEKWGFEKLVYRNDKKQLIDRKYAVQPRNIFATSVHLSDDFQGKSTLTTENVIKYFHYHGSIAQHWDLCRLFLSNASIEMYEIPFVLDTTLRTIGPSVKDFELKTIGPRLLNTRV